MNIVVALTEYLSPVIGDAAVCLGSWDESPGEEDTEFLSVNMDGGSKPGVISRSRIIELYYVSKVGSADLDGGKMNSFNRAYEIAQYIEDNPKSSCFANIILFTGIIGPKETERMRQVYQFSIEVTH